MSQHPRSASTRAEVLQRLAPQKRYLARTTAEQRAPLYADIEDILSPGFLSLGLKVGPLNLAMRTLCPGDRFLLRYRLLPNAPHKEWRIWVVASSIWMLGGQVLLEDPYAPVRVKQALSDLPSFVVDKLFHGFLGLRNRQTRAIAALSSYCYEDQSRQIWRGSGRQPPGREFTTGVPGSGRLGLNSFQRWWVDYNQSEDERLRDLSEWANVKASISVHANKSSINRINARDKNALKLEEERRQRVQDRFFYVTTGIISEDDEFLGQPNRIQTATTDDQLVDEMQRWVSGEMDDHDRAIEAYKEEHRRRFERYKENRRRRQEELRKIAGPAPVVGVPVELTGYSPEELREVMGPASRSGVTTVFQKGDEHKQERWLQKYGLHPALEVTGEGQVRPSRQKSLDEQLEGRQFQADLSGEKD